MGHKGCNQDYSRPKTEGWQEVRLEIPSSTKNATDDQRISDFYEFGYNIQGSA